MKNSGAVLLTAATGAVLGSASLVLGGGRARPADAYAVSTERTLAPASRPRPAGPTPGGDAAVPGAASGSIRFLANEPRDYDFGDQLALPPTFGAGEFTLEIWIKPDTSFPIGTTARGSPEQLINWTEDDVEPYSRGGWWFAGNWLLDGHTRPRGFTPRDTREGTFSLQFYGGGRLRWMFADDADDVPVGKVWAVQAYPASTVPSLLDGAWHHVACVRRWVGDSEALLELWIDGVLTATTRIPRRVDMRRFWDDLPHPDDPDHLGGWAWGSEVMTAWDFFFSQYEDYKGLVDEIRFWDRAKPPDELSGAWNGAVTGWEAGLVGWFPFDEESGRIVRDRLAPTRTIVLHRSRPGSWSRESAPLEASANRGVRGRR